MFFLYFLPPICIVALFIRRLYKFRNYPDAPGPTPAKYTRWWYLKKVYDGKFEQWDVDQHARHGPIVRVAPQMYSIGDPAAMKPIYGIGSPLEKSSWYEYWGDPRVPNHNLFSSTDSSFHATMRRKVANLYTMTAIKSYEPYVNNCVRVLQEQLDRFAAKGEWFDLQHFTQCYALDVIGEITYGNRFGVLDSGGQDVGGILASLEKLLAFGTLAGIEPRFLPFWIWRYGNPETPIRAFDNRQQELRREKGSINGATDFFTKCEALCKKDPVEWERYRGPMAMTQNVAAGSDTTSIALTSAIFHIISNREVYLKLKEEIRAAEEQGEADDPITFDQAQALPYLGSCIKEAMRVHPSTGLPLWRVVPEPGMTISGVFFPAGAVVGINTWVAHRDPRVFGPDPNVFRPERWDPKINDKDKLKQMEAYYMPFGAGTRTCIGKNISILEISKVIPQLIRRYDFELARPGQPIDSLNYWFVKQRNLLARIRQ
ncbi:hypothetical protein J7T55_008085 [Diaporthe amygdali]|uniref:uncharacterized protein n=1 Tax=Phomopsis amygdali TaxID=1214568 RepID=UPI0022FEBF05|nr:uncharacterized protein J7T55_008085 [Diaporthe amygdali]KAJ0107950.1 hypothetical protein J7T55_008085 [Diaporthe amygdali]